MNYDDQIKQIKTQLKLRNDMTRGLFPKTFPSHIILDSGSKKALKGKSLNAIGGVPKGRNIGESYAYLEDLLYDMFFVQGETSSGGGESGGGGTVVVTGSGIYWDGTDVTSENEINF